jgi:hypothetical protein
MKTNSFSTTANRGILFLVFLVSLPAAGQDASKAAPSSLETVEKPRENYRTISFSWRPKNGPAAAYRLPESEGRHRIIIFDGVEKQTAPSLLAGFHGQPKRGKAPKNYVFGDTVLHVVQKMIEAEEIPPIILVLPVFRFTGQNWPGFNPADFKKKVLLILKEQKITPKNWYLFGHSGAAGCGGEGLNQAHLISPEAVGFFDTCLGTGWQAEIKALKKAGIRTVNLHSVETAGFRPRQRPEYQADFDFGRAYGPLGIRPVKCPANLPEAPLREQPYRCAADKSGKIESFVVDTGIGVEAHTKLLPEALRYFLKRFVSR